MKAVPRRAIAALVLIVAARLTHGVCGDTLAGRDLIAAVVGGDPLLVLAAAALVMSRLFLYLLAPGWALHIAARTLLERRHRPG